MKLSGVFVVYSGKPDMGSIGLSMDGLSLTAGSNISVLGSDSHINNNVIGEWILFLLLLVNLWKHS